MTVKVRDITKALDDITNGRCCKGPEDWASGKNPYVCVKSSGVPGKAVVETPGLVWGDPDMEVKKVAVLMTMTESAIELAAATGVNAIIAHHTVAEACNSGGVLFKYYFGCYNLAAFELHEAFHGTHPGIPWLHGHKPYWTTTALGGETGMVAYVGEVLPEIKTVGDMMARLDKLMNVTEDLAMLDAERKIRGCEDLHETSIAARGKILLGSPDSPMKKVIHMFPHTGFSVKHLDMMIEQFPEVDTLMATISRVYPGHDLIKRAEELGLNFVCGNSHGMELFENGIPLAQALKAHLPELDVRVFRERMTSFPVDEIGSPEMREYGKTMARDYLHRK